MRARQIVLKDIGLVLLCWGLVGIGATLFSGKAGFSPLEGTPAFVELIELRERMAAGTVLPVDARDAYHFGQGHIPGAMSLPRARFDREIERARPLLEKASLVVVYCADRNCPDAERVAGRLRKHGFSRIAVYRGGWKEWREGRVVAP